jgi:hypothetical protein
MLLLLVAAGSIFPQSPAPKVDPRVQRLVDDWVKQHPAFGRNPEPVKTLSGVLPAIPAAPISPCSVPLIEMQIPKNVEFSIRRAAPPKNFSDNMQVSVPAPACSR